MHRRHALAWFIAAIFGCGSRSELDVLGRVTSAAGQSSGAAPSSGGYSWGGVAGRPAAGGAGVAHGGVSGSASGSAAGGEPGGGEPGGGAPGGGAPSEGGEGGSGGEAALPPRPVGLALGAFTSCVHFDDGGLRCWGSGGYIGSGSKETIGDNETPDTLPPVVIGGKILQVSNSWYHTCARLESDKVRCFGNGDYGMLGYANTADVGDDETPELAGDVNVGGKVIEVAVGPTHTCALLENGKVRCWGDNDDFQLGYADPSSVGDDEHPASAGFVDVGALALQVVTGYVHSCVLTEAHQVRCWGKSLGGALGYGNLETIGDDEAVLTAGDVNVGGKVVQLGAGMLHTCALLDTGRVRCWGASSKGRLGYGNYEDIGDDETPADAGDVPIGGKVVQLAVGDHASCVLLEGGSVRCWGSGENGELGYGSIDDVGDDETPADAGDVPLGGRATRVDVGFLHACAILEAGTVRCWGRASPGSLGYGNTEDIGDDETPASAGDVKLH